MAEPSANFIPTRATLLDRLKDCEDQASWQQFYDTYHELIFRFAMRAGLSEAEADEAVQDTIIGVARKLPEYRYDSTRCSFKTWLLNLATWRIRDQFRKRQRATSNTNLDDHQASLLQDTSAEKQRMHWEADWRHAALESALRRVQFTTNLRDCQIFEFLVLHDWRPIRVAAEMGVTIARVYLARHRVTKKVRSELRRMDLDAI